MYLRENTGVFRDVLNRNPNRVISDAVNRVVDEGIHLH